MSCSLYVHIPFCITKCYYCDFTSFTGLEHMQEDYVKALLAEMKLYEGMSLRTVYIGGGTPTCMDPILVSRILQGIGQCFDTRRCIEISIEANPGTLSAEMLHCLRQNGVNRLSIGLQSWHPSELATLGRTHDRKDFIKSYHRARAAGFDNINIDIMFGIPGQSIKSWAKTLQAVTDLNPEHLSCYSLKVEDGTLLHRMMTEGLLEKPDPDIDRDMYHYGSRFLARRGYERYEISNFAKEGSECVHNMIYWDGDPYIGIGVSAHSYTEGIRHWNTADIYRYCSMQKDGLSAVEGSEVLSADERIFEFIFLRLRTRRGISLNEFKQMFGKDIYTLYEDQLMDLKRYGLIESDGTNIWLTQKGVDLSNSVFVRFLK